MLGRESSSSALRLATSRYQAQELILASGLVPVRTSVGGPRFPLRYAPVYLKELAPWGLRGIADHAAFATSYRARLESFGVEMLTTRFAEISRAYNGRGLVLLCFEPAGAFCHRRVFADWWLERTGCYVPELSGEQAPLFGSTASI